MNKTRSCACKLKYLLLWLVNLEFFFTFRKKMGQSGDGKRNILLGWPKWHCILASSPNFISKGYNSKPFSIISVLSPPPPAYSSHYCIGRYFVNKKVRNNHCIYKCCISLSCCVDYIIHIAPNIFLSQQINHRYAGIGVSTLLPLQIFRANSYSE